MIKFIYGVVIDTYAPRGGQGVPVFFDGWYADRSAAEEALKYYAGESPEANAYLVKCLKPPTVRKLGIRSPIIESNNRVQ